MSADETREVLVSALIDLLDDRGPDAISVREIAAHAGVNHGLVHRYFGSKDALVLAAAARITDEMNAGFPDRPGMSAFTFAYLRERPHIARVLARLCLDGRSDVLAATRPDPERYAAILAPLKGALDQVGVGGQIEPATVNALAICALFGWFVFRPVLEDGYELPADADDQLASVLPLLDLMVASVPSEP